MLMHIQYANAGNHCKTEAGEMVNETEIIEKCLNKIGEIG